ncbi:unnamed protein product [Protopolystoma xenopodis]|uniref:Uncharacterized protein n=1 Tax=Protopolystoma xenopodis TaxID=117903 RepID=A0A3S5FG37_9PLAT|nr:unnamed protein product [Protopolystoma xenopodis]
MRTSIFLITSELFQSPASAQLASRPCGRDLKRSREPFISPSWAHSGLAVGSPAPSDLPNSAQAGRAKRVDRRPDQSCLLVLVRARSCVLSSSGPGLGEVTSPECHSQSTCHLVIGPVRFGREAATREHDWSVDIEWELGSSSVAEAKAGRLTIAFSHNEAGGSKRKRCSPGTSINPKEALARRVRWPTVKSCNVVSLCSSLVVHEERTSLHIYEPRTE